MKIRQVSPHSHRQDAQVPNFEDEGPVVFMDGSCGLCSRAARSIARLDRRGEFRICTTQSPLGQAVLTHYGLDPSDPQSWLYLENGHAYTSLDAVIRAGRRLGGAGRIFGVFSILPRGVQDWIYARIARNRYRFFGRTDLCAIPDREVSKRLLK